MIKLGIANFQSVRAYQEVSLGGISLLYGENSSGKSIIKNVLRVLANISESPSSMITTNDWFNHQAQSNGDDLSLSVTYSASENYMLQSWDDVDVDFTFNEIVGRTAYGFDTDLLFHNELEPIWKQLTAHLKSSSMQVLYTWRWSARAEPKCIEIRTTEANGLGSANPVLKATFSDKGEIHIHFYLEHPFIADLLRKPYEVALGLKDLVVHNGHGRGDFEDVFTPLFSALVRATFNLAELNDSYDLAPLLSIACLVAATEGVRQFTSACVVDAVRTVTEQQYRTVEATSSSESIHGEKFDNDYWNQLKGLLIRNRVFPGYDLTVDEINGWLTKDNFLQTDYELDADFRLVVDIGDANSLKPTLELPVTTLTAEAANEIESDQDTIAKHSTLMLRDRRTGNRVQFANAGSGMAFVLPILYTLSFRINARIVYIQEPELHLHPKMQAGLAEVVADAYMQSEKSRTVILETHSELFALRLLRLIRASNSVVNIRPTSNLTSSNVNFTAVYKDESGQTLYKTIRVSRSGEFLDSWPNGFFQEQERELFE